tara:strand:+ start:1079 stop:1378 length:300 start_codon:yes stop_codon:yes gene_type:complete
MKFGNKHLLEHIRIKKNIVERRNLKMKKIMEIFKDDNNWNEKAIVGFIAFAIMCLIMVADLVTGWVGKDLVINEFVYDSFVWVVLGSFGISGVEKFAKT